MIEDAWHIMRIVENGDGTARVYHQTNDNLDQGWASQYADWSERFNDIRAALHSAGESRQGIACTVTVYLNGKKI